LVTAHAGIRFYAAAALVDSAGHALGTLCVLDRQPRTLEPRQREALIQLARTVVRLLSERATSTRPEERAQTVPQSAAEERFRVLFEYSSDAHLIFDADGIIDCNQAAVAMIGCTAKSQMIGLHPARLSPRLQPDGRRSGEKCIEMDALARQRGHHRFEWDHLRQDGVIIPVEVTLTPVPLAGRTVLLAVWHDLTQRKHHEAVERQRERRWLLALEASGDGVWDWEPGSRQVYFSPRWKALLGHAVDGISDDFDEWARRIHPEDQAAVHAELQAHLAGATTHYVKEYRMACFDGGWKWVLDRGQVVERHPDGRPRRMIGTLSDLSARRRMEDSLQIEQERFRASLARFDLVASGAAMGIWETRFATDRPWQEQFGDLQPFYWSPRLLAIIGHEDGDFPARWSALVALMHPDHVALGHAAFTDCLDAGVPCNVELQLRHRSGRYLWIHATGEVERDGAGRPLRMAGSLSDITARKRNEELLGQTQVRLLDAVSAIDAGFVMFDHDDCVVICNARFIDLYGLPEWCSRPGTPYRDILKALIAQGSLHELGDRQEEWVAECLTAHLRTGHDREVRLAGRWIRIAERRLADGDIVSLHTDVTTLKRAAEEMRQARDLAEQATRSKAEFLATMSHEIRTPMNGVIGMTSMLLDTALTAQQLEYATIVRSCGDTLVALINDILDFSKIEAGALQLERIPFDPRRLIEDALAVVAAQAHAKGLELVAMIAPQVPESLIGDPARLRQIVFNLLSNAIKFTARGEVVLMLDAAPAEAGCVAATLTVRDTGIGIPEHARAHLFQPFAQADSTTTRRFGGTGLGLVICQRLATYMDGGITFASEPGRGSEFTCLMRFAVCATGTVGAPPPATPGLIGRNALLIGGHPLARQALRALLLGWGMRSAELASWSPDAAPA
ncbi:MAG: PAS domain-containing protein, partial [Planctomycetes bacterium]|nr:PAS domain-containing protein [Planctomycetota bacterium]